jgi:CheY-like chemotaxis protein
MTGRPDAETADRCDGLGAYLVLKDADFLVEMSEALMELFPDRCSAIADVFHLTESAPVRARPLVLLIDDDPETEHILSSRLRKSGVEVLYASDGKEGFAVARREKPSVIVTDYHMPYGDAIYLLSRLRNDAATLNVPVVVMTGRYVDEMIKRQPDAGFFRSARSSQRGAEIIRDRRFAQCHFAFCCP